MQEYKIPLDKQINLTKLTNEIRELIVKLTEKIEIVTQGNTLLIKIESPTFKDLIELVQNHSHVDTTIQDPNTIGVRGRIGL